MAHVSVAMMVVALAACSAKSTDPPAETPPSVAPAAAPAPATAPVEPVDPRPTTDDVPAPPPANDGIETISLRGQEPAKVAAAGLSARISGSSHKSSAPVVGVSVLVSHGEQLAEVSWSIESGRLDLAWLPVAGRRYDKSTSTYLDEEIAGWQVRLDSVDEQSVGGDPTAITISFRRAP